MPGIPRDQRFEVVLDWICAVLSPGTESKDRKIKLPVYARHAEENEPAWRSHPRGCCSFNEAPALRRGKQPARMSAAQDLHDDRLTFHWFEIFPEAHHSRLDCLRHSNVESDNVIMVMMDDPIQ